MIKINVWNIEEFDNKEEFQKLKRIFKKEFLEDKKAWERRRRKFEFSYDLKLINILSSNTFEKCIYCEQKNDLMIDHFRPSTLSKFLDSDDISEGYWWLAYEVQNLMPTCKGCNEHKRNFFPVAGKRAMSTIPYKDINKVEKRILLDPRFDEPERHIRFTEDGVANPLTNKGQATIEILGLNRKELVFKRNFYANSIVKEFRSLGIDLINFEDMPKEYYSYKIELNFIIEKYLNLMNSKEEFSGLVRNLVAPFLVYVELIPKTHYVFNGFKVKNYLKKKPIQNVKFNLQEKITKIKIRNFMGITDLELDLTQKSEKGNSVVFIGPNGAGKSSILKAISFLVMSDKQRDKFLIDNPNVVYRFGKQGFAEIYVEFDSGLNNYSVTINPVTNSIVEFGTKPKVNILAYGPNRILMKNNKYRVPKRKNIGAMLSPYYFVSNAHHWCADTAELSDAVFENIALSLCNVFEMNDESIVRNYGELKFKVREKHESFIELSEGYKSIVSIILDIALNFSSLTSDFTQFTGIVMIDEIENHLHPLWKKNVGNNLLKMFPNIQFFFTTHDPLVVSSLVDCEIIKMEIEDGVSYAKPMSSPVGKNADQILTGAFFELESTIDQATTDIYKLYLTELVSDKNSNQVQMIESSLRDRLGRFSETSIERLAHIAVAENIGNQLGKVSSERKKEIILDVKNKIKGFKL